MAPFTSHSIIAFSKILLFPLLLLPFLTLPDAAVAVPDQELEAMLAALRSRKGYGLAENAIAASEILSDFVSAVSLTFFAPSDASLFALDMASPVSLYTLTIRSHVAPRRYTISELLLLPPGSSIPALLPCRRPILLSYRRRFLAPSVITADSVNVAVPGLFYSPHIAVHGLSGRLDFRYAPDYNLTAFDPHRSDSCAVALASINRTADPTSSPEISISPPPEPPAAAHRTPSPEEQHGLMWPRIAPSPEGLDTLQPWIEPSPSAPLGDTDTPQSHPSIESESSSSPPLPPDDTDTLLRWIKSSQSEESHMLPDISEIGQVALPPAPKESESNPPRPRVSLWLPQKLPMRPMSLETQKDIGCRCRRNRNRNLGRRRERDHHKPVRVRRPHRRSPGRYGIGGGSHKGFRRYTNRLTTKNLR